MIKSTYHFLHKTTITLILILFVITVLLTHKYTLVFLAQNFLKTNDIEYSKVQGTLFDGIILYDVKYKDILHAKKIQLNYKLLSFIKFKPIIKKIQTQQLYINVDKIPHTNNENKFALIPFIILKLKLNKSKIIIDKKKYRFDLEITNLLYNNTFNTNNLSIKLKSYYANAAIKAKIVDNTIIGHSDDVTLTNEVHKRYLNFIKALPPSLSVDLKLNTEEISLQTHLPSLQLATKNDLGIYDQDLNIKYDIKKKSFFARSDYTLAYQNYLSTIHQETTFNTKGEYNATLNVALNNFPKSTPFDCFDANISGNPDYIHLDANSSDFFLNISSNDYKKYQVKVKNEKLKLSFLDSLPPRIKEHKIAFNAYSLVHISPFSMNGVLHTADEFAHINATFKYTPQQKQLAAQIEPITKTDFYKNNNLQLLSPIAFNYQEKNNNSIIRINANRLQAFIKKNEKNKLEGYGNFASARFNLNGNINKQMHINLKLHTSIPSIKEFLQDTNLSLSDDKTVYDGRVNINSNIHFNEHLSINSNIKAPFLSAKTDSQNRYVLKDVLFKTSYKNKKIYIYNYRLHYKEQKFYSNKISSIYIDHNISLHIEKFYVYDKLVLRGTIDPFESRMKLNLHSDKFSFHTHDIDVKAKTNININVENTQKQLIDGNITLLEGTISYQPQHDYAISDDDIIIIQDIQKQKRNNLFLNLHIDALKAINYKTKEINVQFIPQITLKKIAGEKVKLYGKVIIVDGIINTQAKEFTFDRSELIFSGEKHLNPELNIKLHFQTIDYKDIIIRISNTLNSPILIFSSNPAMSQNDIMSYILFNEPANTLFDNSGATNKTSINYLLLGTGIKTIFNQTTGIHVDTLNILNNENGTLGYEVGARLNKKIRIVYKNDITSSMILQYNLGRSLRVDVDVHDTGQGVYFIYTKDFKGF